jgi:hypothetical protein
MLLQTNINPVQDTLEMSRAISEYGILIVLSALMIISFIAMGIMLFKMMRSTNDKIIESQNRVEKQNEQIIVQNETIRSLLDKISDTETTEALLEQTKWNTEKLLRVSVDTNLIVLLKGASEILSHNHIENKNFTEKRIKALVNSSHFDRVKWLNSFRYKGTRLGDLANTDSWIEKKVGIIHKFIYSPEKSMDLLVRDLSLAYTEFNNQLDL